MNASDVEKVEQFFATYNARRHLALYRREPDVRFLRMAYREYERVGLSTPDWLRAEFEKVDAALTDKASTEDVRAALGMRLSRPQLSRLSVRRDIAEEFRIMTVELGLRPQDAKRRIAAQRAMTITNVARMISQWGGLIVDHSRSHGRHWRDSGVHLQRLFSTGRAL